MRKTSTYLALAFAVTASAALTIAACTPDSTAPSTVAEAGNAEAKLNRLRAQFNFMGDYHTQGLAYVATRINDKESKKLTKQDRCRVALAAMKEFHKAYRLNGRPLSYNDLLTVDDFCSAGSRGDFKVVSNLIAAPGSLRRNELSPSAAAYLAEMEQVFDTGLDSNGMASRIYEIQAEAAATLPEGEAGAVIGIGSIGLSSIDYWTANLAAWESTDPTEVEPDQQPASADLEKVMKADIAAALTTLIYTWFTGPVGIEAAIARGLAASIVAAIFS